MEQLQKHVLGKIKNAIDTDDLLDLAELIEGVMPIEKIQELETELKKLISNNELNSIEATSTNQFLNFLCD